ncbi:MAG: hypothetical protein PHR36_01690 [Patescibacteria group bacterium]|nr:hypothetical protein [Patescibacteria group bacterium]
MNYKIIKIIILILFITALAVLTVKFVFLKNILSSDQGTGNNIATSTPEKPTSLEYRNNQYGFIFTLPISWTGYTIANDVWTGYSTGNAGDQKYTAGPLLSIRHPLWTEKIPRQDIPIMVFTIGQWQDLQNDKFHIGAAPIGPSELGRNAKYVFALPARYNFAFPVGYEEVDQVIQSHPLQAF